MPRNLFINFGVKNMHFFHVSNIEVRDSSEHTVSIYYSKNQILLQKPRGRKNFEFQIWPSEFLANQCQPIGPMWADWPALFSRYLKRQGLSKEFHSERDTLGSIAQKGHSRISARNFSFGLKNSGGDLSPLSPL